jgi:arginine/lysine/ornithine decarboxylase
VLSPRDAFFASHRRVDLAHAAGSMAAKTLAVHPPGIPNALLGSDRSLRAVKVVDTPTRNAGSD